MYVCVYIYIYREREIHNYITAEAPTDASLPSLAAIPAGVQIRVQAQDSPEYNLIMYIICMCMYRYIYIYIYIERERERLPVI